MDVNTVANISQAQQPVPQQDGASGADGLFAYLLKHSFGSAVAGSTMLDAQSLFDMIGGAPLPVSSAPTPILTNDTASQTQTSPSTSGQTGSPQFVTDNSSAAPTATATNSDGSGNGTNAQTDSGNSSSGQQQNGSSPIVPQGNGPARTVTQSVSNAVNNNGNDATTEATAAALATPIIVVQQVRQAQAPQTGSQGSAVDPLLDTVSGPQAQGPAAQGPATTAAPTAAAATQSTQATLAAANDSEPEEGPAWSANFLASAATTPQVAQQALSLSQLTNNSGTASVSTQTSSSNPVSAPSASALVPDAVLAISAFFGDGQQGGASDSGNSGNQSGNQQTSTDNSDPSNILDPSAALLAETSQLMFAFSSAIQSAVQDMAAAQPQSVANVAATTGAAAPETPALPQPVANQTANSTPTNFDAELQESGETQQTQAPRPASLPAAVDQIKMQIEQGLQQGSTTIKVELTPENMGRVEVKLDVQNGTVKATITADRPQTLALLQGDQQGMVQALQDAGLNADASSLSFYLRGDQQRQYAQSGRQQSNQSGGGSSSDDSALDAVDGVSGATSTAGAGTVDISV